MDGGKIFIMDHRLVLIFKKKAYKVLMYNLSSVKDRETCKMLYLTHPWKSEHLWKTYSIHQISIQPP